MVAFDGKRIGAWRNLDIDAGERVPDFAARLRFSFEEQKVFAHPVAFDVRDLTSGETVRRNGEPFASAAGVVMMLRKPGVSAASATRRWRAKQLRTTPAAHYGGNR